MDKVESFPLAHRPTRRAVIAGGVGISTVLLPAVARAASGGELAPAETTTTTVDPGSGTPLPAASTWTSRADAADLGWNSVTYGEGTFVAVANSGTGNRVMTSPDGSTWTSVSATDNSKAWKSVAYGNGVFVAVQSGSGNQVMTSPDGATWTSVSTGLVQNSWIALTYGTNGFVAVAQSGGIMSSPDGTTWTSRTSPGGGNQWTSITFGNGLYLAMGNSTGTAGMRAATSANGSTWSSVSYGLNPVYGDDDSWRTVTFGEGVFVALGYSYALVRDQAGTWTFVEHYKNQFWNSVVHGNGLFAAVAGDGTDRVMTSPDGT